MLKKLAICGIVSLLGATLASAGNITIFDERSIGGGSGQGLEVGETEPDMVNATYWDLRAFNLESNALGITAGYDLRYGYGGTVLGDIFIDINGDAQFGSGAHAISTTNPQKTNFGYEYAIQLDFSNLTYDVYSLKTTGSSFISAYSYNSPESDPFKLNVTTENSIRTNLGFSYTRSALGKTNPGFTNSISGIDLSFLGSTDFTSHVTMSCGNDNLMGYGTTSVPEPSSLGFLLLGISLLAGLKFRKKQ